MPILSLPVATLWVSGAVGCVLASILLRLLGRHSVHEAFLAAASVLAMTAATAWPGKADLALLTLAGLGGIWGLNRVLAAALAKAGEDDRRNLWLAVGLAANLAWLAVVHWTQIAAPAGRSSVTATLPFLLAPSLVALNAAGYLWEVARRRIVPEARGLALHLFFVPKLLVGPVMGPRAFATAVRAAGRRSISVGVGHGVMAMVVGLFKAEVLTAALVNPVLPVVAAVRAGDAVALFDALGCVLALGVAGCFALSGIADVGRGVAMLFGLHLPVSVRRPLAAGTPLKGLVRLHPGVAGFAGRLIAAPLVRRGVPGWAAAGLAAAFVTGPLFGWRAGNLMAAPLIGILVATCVLVGRLGGEGIWGPVLRRLCWPVNVGVLSCAAAAILIGSPEGWGHMLAGLAGHNGAPIPAALQNLVGALARTVEWHPATLGNPLIVGHGVGLLSLFALLAGLLLAQAVPRLFDRHKGAVQTVWFALALYFLAAWYFAGEPLAVARI